MAKDVSLLACKAKDNPAYMAPLWNAVRRLIGLWASKYAQHIALNGNSEFDVDDLIQSGYLALVEAVDGYDPENEAGAEFTTYLRFAVRRQFAKVTGHYTTKKRPEQDAVSIDAPLPGQEGLTLLGTLPDPAAEFEEKVIQREAARQDCAALMVEIEKLPEEQRRALMLTSWDDLTVKAAAEVMGVPPSQVRRDSQKAAHTVRNTKTGRRMEKDYCAHFVSLKRYKTTLTSEVEEYILWMDQHGILYD